MTIRLLLPPALLAVAAQAPFPPPKPRPDPEVAVAKMYREAADRFVVFWGGPPDPRQWEVIRQDVAAIPPEAVWWLRRHGRPVVLLKGSHPEQWPGLEATAASRPSGLAPNHGPTVVDVDRAYPLTPNGVAVGGSSLILHELGHVLDRLLATNPEGGYPTFLSHQPRWLGYHARVRWPHAPGYAGMPSEAFAESFSLWCMVRKGGFERRLPANIDPLMLEYWDETAKLAGWRVKP